MTKSTTIFFRLQHLIRVHVSKPVLRFVTRKDVRYFKCAIMKEHMTCRRWRKSRQNIHRCDEHGQDGDLKVLILNPTLFKIANWKICRHINLFTDTSLIDNNLCIQSFRAFCVVIRQKLGNMLDKREFQSVQYQCHVTCLQRAITLDIARYRLIT